MVTGRNTELRIGDADSACSTNAGMDPVSQSRPKRPGEPIGDGSTLLDLLENRPSAVIRIEIGPAREPKRIVIPILRHANAGHRILQFVRDLDCPTSDQDLS